MDRAVRSETAIRRRSRHRSSSRIGAVRRLRSTSSRSSRAGGPSSAAPTPGSQLGSERELRRRLKEAGDPGKVDGLEEELAAYRAVWAGLEIEPSLELDAGFARRTARAALAERGSAVTARTTVAAGPANPAGRWAGTLAAAASTVTLATALGAAVLVLPAAGIEVGGPLRRIVRAAATVPTALWGILGTAAALYVVDAAWAWRMHPTRFR